MTDGPRQIRAWTVGLDMAYSVVGMLMLGAAIDFFAGTKPWWMLGLGLGGLVLGMYRFVREAIGMNRAGPGRGGASGGENRPGREKPGRDGSP